MKEGQTLWTRDELILAINLYCKIPFGKIHKGNPDVIHLAQLIGRSPGAISRKLGNFASFDPSLKARGIKGLPNTGGLDKVIWNEFYNDWEGMAYESERVLAQYEGKPIERFVEEADFEIREGKDKERLTRVKVNQAFFRSMVLATYDYSCCITGIKNIELLVGSHIVPWNEDKDNRLNPRNGLCLNSLHDKAFDRHLLSITTNLEVILSKRLKKNKKNDFIASNFLEVEGKQIQLPKKFLPDEKFLDHHYQKFKQLDRL
ncbi:MAG: HNH endonuclease [Bacteroidetes bacterium]|nr:HNH endonuclease [Bacteroidota bacterium]